MREERLGTSHVPDEVPEPRLRDRFSETMARLFSDPETDGDIEDDAETKKKRKKGKSARWRTFLRGVFNRSSEEESKQSSESNKTSSFFPFISLERVSTDAEKSKAAEANQDDFAVRQQAPVTSSASETGKPSELHHEKRPESTIEETNISQNEQSPRSVEEEQGVLNIPHDELPPPEVPPPMFFVTPESAPKPSADYQDSSDKTEESPPNRDVGARRLALGLTGLEYLGRKRADRKLVDAQQRQDRESKQIKDKLEQQSVELEDLQKKRAEQNLRYKNAVNAEALREKRGIDQPAAVAASNEVSTGNQIHKPKLESSPEKPTSVAPEREPSKKTPEVTRQPDAMRSEILLQERLRLEQEQKQQEELNRQLEKEIEYNQKIYENAENAAAHGVPVEKYYERRHEVKDEKSSIKPVSVGSVIRDRQPLTRPEVGAYGLSAFGQSREPAPGSSAAANRPGDNAMYVQAAKSGFYTAIVIIAVALVILAL